MRPRRLCGQRRSKVEGPRPKERQDSCSAVSRLGLQREETAGLTPSRQVAKNSNDDEAGEKRHGRRRAHAKAQSRKEQQRQPDEGRNSNSTTDGVCLGSPVSGPWSLVSGSPFAALRLCVRLSLCCC